MDTAELDRLAQAELKEQGFVELAALLGPAQPEPPRTIGTAGLWLLFLLLALIDVIVVFLAVTLA